MISCVFEASFRQIWNSFLNLTKLLYPGPGQAVVTNKMEDWRLWEYCDAGCVTFLCDSRLK